MTSSFLSMSEKMTRKQMRMWKISKLRIKIGSLIEMKGKRMS